LSFVPIALFLNERNTSYIESRYLYACSVPVSILMGICLENLRQTISSKTHIALRYSTLFVGILFMIFVYKQTVVIQRNVVVAVQESDQARHTVSVFLRMKPKLPNKPIIYLESDSRYYLAAPVPFQLGTGYVLMVKYFPSGVVPVDLLVGTKSHYYPFLYNYVDQGYQEVRNKGFGYFADKTKLLDLYNTNPSLTVNQIVGFRYIGREGKLIDITGEIRQYIQVTASHTQK
jgi:hypothetical protein